MELFVMRILARFGVPFGGAREGFTWKQFDGRTVACGDCGDRGTRSVLFVRLAVLVVLEVFKNVADVEKSVAIQANVHESRLHAGEDASNFSFVDAADESEFFFPLDVNFD